MLAETLVKRVVNRMMVSGEPIEEFDGHLFLRCERGVARTEKAGNVLITDRIVFT